VPPYPAVRKYIAIDWDASYCFFSVRPLLTRFQAMELVYSDEPTLFKLERRAGGQQNIFRVMAVNERGHGSEGPVSWQLPSKIDGTHVGLDANSILSTTDEMCTGRGFYRFLSRRRGMGIFLMMYRRMSDQILSETLYRVLPVIKFLHIFSKLLTLYHA
jgi:hypothetical protein